ncbi:TMV resistance protein N-like [Prosopis cineraria]|uniref:TMV resistance protein N-like n=1 Tax=Prosopis cineraria TaxID=364024 RepID=UPI00240FB9A7|nr:TMV resistance protein N-like [Prosopis cineraria]XP_054792717.1 TMV resistance protein N-like [Prosopis cineraria]
MALNVKEASSSNSSDSNSTQNWKFDVFMSYRGSDIRISFVGYLYAALCREGFKVYSNYLDDLSPVITNEFLKAIEDSRFAIVLISQSYADSEFCLDMLQHILATRKQLGQQVIPIFYGVDPSDLRDQKKSFAVALDFWERKFQDDVPHKVQKWKDCLTEVADLSGFNSKGLYEAELVQNVVEHLRIQFGLRN